MMPEPHRQSHGAPQAPCLSRNVAVLLVFCPTQFIWCLSSESTLTDVLLKACIPLTGEGFFSTHTVCSLQISGQGGPTCS